MAPTPTPIPTPKPQKRVKFDFLNSSPAPSTFGSSGSILRSSSATPRFVITASKHHQIEYRSYQNDIEIYHFDTSTIPDVKSLIHLIRNSTHSSYRFTDMCIGEDTLRGLTPPDGDEIPPGRIEVGYLHSIFPVNGSCGSGSALGFRESGKITWLCFRDPVQDTILTKWHWDVANENVIVMQPPAEGVVQIGFGLLKIFDHVGTMPKGITGRRVRGANEEHRKWYDSLWRAPRKIPSQKQKGLRITYKELGRDMQAHHEKLRKRGIRLEEREKWNLGEPLHKPLQVPLHEPLHEEDLGKMLYAHDMLPESADAKYIRKRLDTISSASRSWTVAEWTKSQLTLADIDLLDRNDLSEAGNYTKAETQSPAEEEDEDDSPTENSDGVSDSSSSDDMVCRPDRK